jgi:hypothetical protein
MSLSVSVAKRKALLSYTLVSFLTGLLLVVNVTAQNSFTGYSADKTLRSNARVNPSTLGMELAIPLPSYPGRAGSSLPNAVTYSSKVWTSGDPTHYRNQLGNVVTSVYPTFSDRAIGGWTQSLGVPYLDQVPNEIYDEQGNPWDIPTEGVDGDPNNGNLYYIKRYRVIMPDGSTHEMRVDDARHNYGTEQMPGYDPGDSKYVGTYVSVDGSRMRLEFNYTNNVWHSTLYMPDGGRYLDLPSQYSSSGTVTYIDRNGNKMSYNLSTGQWTDTLGRTITKPFAGYTATGPSTAGDLRLRRSQPCKDKELFRFDARRHLLLRQPDKCEGQADKGQFVSFDDGVHVIRYHGPRSRS